MERIPEGARVIGLARRSSKGDRQRDSIADQRQQIVDFCEYNKLTLDATAVGSVGGIFEHSGSAIDIQRDDISQIVEYIELSQTRNAYVVISALDRLTRSKQWDVKDQLKELCDLGVRLIICQMGPHYFQMNDGGDQDTLLRQIEMAHYYVQALATNVSRGLYARSERGETPPSQLFGFRVEKTHDSRQIVETWDIIPDERELAALQQVKDRYIAGDRKFAIVKWLNENGFKTSRGKPFSISSLDSMITNSIYAGVWERFKYAAGKLKRVGKHGIAANYNRFKKRVGVRDVDAKGKVELNPDVRRIRVLDDENLADKFRPVVVFTEDEHRAILTRYESRDKKTTQRKHRKWAYSGFLFCGECGRPMRGFITSKGVRRYQCSGHQVSGECKHRKAIDEDHVTWRVLYEYYSLVEQNTGKIFDIVQEKRQAIAKGPRYRELQYELEQQKRQYLEASAKGQTTAASVNAERMAEIEKLMTELAESVSHEDVRTYPQNRFSLTSEINTLDFASTIDGLRDSARQIRSEFDKSLEGEHDQFRFGLIPSPPAKELIEDVVTRITVHFKEIEKVRKTNTTTRRKHFLPIYADVEYAVGLQASVSLYVEGNADRERFQSEALYICDPSEK